jgi:hypothetical protein
MSKAEEQRQARRDREQEYWVKNFRPRLRAATTIASARQVVNGDLPQVGAVGRLRHTNLSHVLGCLSTRSQPAIQVNRSSTIRPDFATVDECVEYVALFRRFAEAGEISQSDSEHVALALTNAPYVDWD